MTVDNITPGGEVGAVNTAVEGLEDYDPTTDAITPRLRILGKVAKFEDGLTNEQFDEIDVILLGLVKQRILWDANEQESKSPMCKSLNFTEGRPDVKEFPFKQAGFPATLDEDVVLACGSCALTQWGSHPKNTTPWCGEQHVYPLLMKREDEYGEAIWMPAILTLQRSGLQASKQYTSAFHRSAKPLYTATTKITLQAMKNGSVDYAKPIITRVGDTDVADHPQYAQQYRKLRAFLQTPHTREDEGESDDSPSSASSSTASATPSTPPPASYDDEPPF